MALTVSQRVEGSLLGTALGDSIGLPYEGVSRRRAAKLLGVPDRHRFLFGRGMVSDDTEHSCMVAEAIAKASTDPALFQKELARRFRWWLASAPAGVGKATAISIIRLWLGWSPNNSGIFSAGNGPAMRSPVLGALIQDRDILKSLVRASTRLTHTDPKAEYGALVIATMTRLAASGRLADSGVVGDEVMSMIPADEPVAQELRGLIEQAIEAADAGQSSKQFAASIGLDRGVTGYTYHTVPVAVHASLRYHDNFKEAIVEVVLCGGDTDTVAAIVGGILGASMGPEELPQDWVDKLCEWPRSPDYIKRLAQSVVQSLESPGQSSRRSPIFPAVVLRNLFFFCVVLVHILRRLLPPY